MASLLHRAAIIKVKIEVQSVQLTSLDDVNQRPVRYGSVSTGHVCYH